MTNERVRALVTPKLGANLRLPYPGESGFRPYTVHPGTMGTVRIRTKNIISVHFDDMPPNTSVICLNGEIDPVNANDLVAAGGPT